MKVTKLAEYGYEESALGFSLSYNSTIERAKQIMPKYAFGIPGENKFLESIYIWWDITAPRFWWQEADTYRLTTKQSESTMHTLTKKPVSVLDFEDPVPDIFIELINNTIENYKDYHNGMSIADVKNLLPEGYLQRRIWVMNYKVLQNIYIQRLNHKLPQWRHFIGMAIILLDHPEFIAKDYKLEN